MKRIQCVTCDRLTTTPDAHGFCLSCSTEFEQVRQRLRCAKDCTTPLSCLQQRRCLHAENTAQAALDFN